MFHVYGQVLELFDNMKLCYFDIIYDLQWMENSTKIFVKNKIQKIADLQLFVVQPPWMEDRSKLEEF